jgi:hypothetical protein
VSAAGATHILALRPATTCGVTATLKQVTPIWLRATSTKTATGTSIVVDVPAGTQANDFMFMVLAWGNVSATPTAPSGWTAASSTSNTGIWLYTYKKVASASEPANYTWTLNASNPAIAAWVGSYVNVDTTTPTDNVNPSWDSSGTTHTTSNPITRYEDDMVLAIYAIGGNVTYTTPGGTAAEGNPIAGTGTYASLAVFDGVQGVLGAIAKTTTSSASGLAAMTIVSLKPATAPTTLGTDAVSIASPTSTTLFTKSFSTSAATFATGDRLELDVTAGQDCNGALSYDGASEPSKLTVATIVPEGFAGLLLLAPALPLAARWWKRRRP